MNKLLALMLLGMLDIGSSMSTTPLKDSEAAPSSRFRVPRIPGESRNDVPKKQTHEEDRKALLSLCEGYWLLEREPALRAAMLGEWRSFQESPPKRPGLFFRINTDFLGQGTVAFEIRNHSPNWDFLVLSYATRDHPASVAARCLPQMYDLFKVLQKYAEQDSDDCSGVTYPKLFYVTRIPSIPKIYISGRGVCSGYFNELVRTSLQGKGFSYSLNRELPGEFVLSWLNNAHTAITQEFLMKRGWTENADKLSKTENPCVPAITQKDKRPPL